MKLDHSDWANDYKDLEPAEEPGAGAYLSGALGALLGAVVGTLPLLLVGAYTGLFSGWLGFIVGFAAVKGYTMFKGARKHGYAVAVVIGVSVLAVLASCLACTLIYFMQLPEVREASLREGVSAFATAWWMVKQNLPLVLLNYTLPLVVSVAGIVLSRKKLSEYTQPEKLKRAAKAAEQVLRQDGESEIYFPDAAMLKGLRISGILGVVLIVVTLMVFMVLTSVPVFQGTPLGSGWGMLCILLFYIAALLAMGSFLRPLFGALESCLVRDPAGELWRVKPLRLNSIPPYQFGFFTGMVVPNFSKMKPEQVKLAQAAILRAIQDVRDGNVYPGSPLLKIVIPLNSFTVHRETPWVWKGEYIRADGRRKRTAVTKVFPNFHPVPGQEAPGPMPVRLGALMIALLPMAVSILALVLSAAPLPAWAALTPTPTPASTAVRPTYSAYSLDGVILEVDDSWTLDREADGEVSFLSADGRHYYRVIYSALGGHTPEAVFSELLDLYQEKNTVIEEDSVLSPVNATAKDGTAFWHEIYSMAQAEEEDSFVCVAPAVVPDKNLLVTIQGYSKESNSFETAAMVKRMLYTLAFQIGDRDYVSGTTFCDTQDGSQPCLKDDGTFYYYASAEDHARNYYVGTYEVYYGQEAFDKVASMEEYGLTEEELEKTYTSNARGYHPGGSSPVDSLQALTDPEKYAEELETYHVCRDTFYALILHNDSVVMEPGEVRPSGNSVLYIGYYIPELDAVDLLNANVGAYYQWKRMGETRVMDVEPLTDG